MTRGRWLTPNVANPVGQTCRVLLIPDDLEWAAIVNGAVSLLSDPDNYEQFGSATPEQVANRFKEMENSYYEENCRMIGATFPFCTANPPPHCLECDGTQRNRVDYPDLYAALATTFHVNADVFILPDFRGHVAGGVGFFDTQQVGVNETIGEWSHTLITDEMPIHDHELLLTDTGGGDIGAQLIDGSLTPSSTFVGQAGLGFPHNNIQPTLALRWCVVAE